MLRCALFLMIGWLASSALAAGALSVAGLQCEYRPEPLNVDLLHPRLGWTLTSSVRGDLQSAYQVLVASTEEKLSHDQGDLWDSGKVSSDRCSQIAYAGTELKSAQRCFWKLRVWDKSDHLSDWSTGASWSMGLLSPGDWVAKWIAAGGSASGESSALGYHAAVSTHSDDVKWVQVDLGKSYPIESVKLHALDHEVAGFGFPIRFTIMASDDPDFKQPVTITDQSQKDFPNPGAVAVTFKADAVKRRYLRVTASRLFQRTQGDHTFCFALAEMEVFSAGRNVALHAPVTALDSTEGYGWGKSELTDGLNLAPDAGTASAMPLKSLPIFRRSFNLTRPVSRATMFICGLGQYELDLNGSKVGDSILDPGWTDYRKTCLYRSYDLTNEVKKGNNVIGVMLGNGMYNVVHTPGRYTKFTGSMGPPKLIAQLQLTFNDGSTQSICTDNSWQVTAGPITFSSIYGGEDYDARLEDNLAESQWQAAVETNGPGGKLVGSSQSAPPITVAAVLQVQQITHPRPDRWVYDMGQNCSQIPSISVTGPEGASVRLTPAEVLKGDGTVSQQPSGGPAYYTYTLRGGGTETWSPRFTYYGCRYFEVSGAVPADAPNPSNLPVIRELHGNFITSSSPVVGEFNCSNAMFNRTAEIIRWAMRNNLMSVLTDCPHREKLGWLEENHLVGPSLMYNLQIPSLFTKVCGDMADAQTADGLVPDIAPEFTVFSGGFRDSPEWGSSSVLIPWQLYQWYGDISILARQYTTMKRYVDYLSKQANNHILSNGLGDWYDLGPKAPGYAQLTPPALTATAFYYRDITILQQTAKLLGKDAESASYGDLASEVRQAFNTLMYHPDTHSYSTGSQTANAIPLVFGMPPEADRPAIIENIVADVRRHSNGLTAGDVGYRYLLRALADGGRSDAIFDMNCRSDRPGYGMIITKGATALTEAWDARLSSSQDHFMLGHIMEWFYGDLAGIAPDPRDVGFKKIIIKPTPVGDVTWAKASYASMNGTIKLSWQINRDTFMVDVLIPPGSVATVMLPRTYANSITEGGKTITANRDLTVEPTNSGSPKIIIHSGSYHFESRSN